MYFCWSKDVTSSLHLLNFIAPQMARGTTLNNHKSMLVFVLACGMRMYRYTYGWKNGLMSHFVFAEIRGSLPQCCTTTIWVAFTITCASLTLPAITCRKPFRRMRWPWKVSPKQTQVCNLCSCHYRIWYIIVSNSLTGCGVLKSSVVP